MWLDICLPSKADEWTTDKLEPQRQGPSKLCSYNSRLAYLFGKNETDEYLKISLFLFVLLR